MPQQVCNFQQLKCVYTCNISNGVQVKSNKLYCRIITQNSSRMHKPISQRLTSSVAGSFSSFSFSSFCFSCQVMNPSTLRIMSTGHSTEWLTGKLDNFKKSHQLLFNCVLRTIAIWLYNVIYVHDFWKNRCKPALSMISSSWVYQFGFAVFTLDQCMSNSIGATRMNQWSPLSWY